MSFELLEPDTLAEAIGLLDPDDAAVRAIAGGTALSLMVQSHFQADAPDQLAPVEW